MILFDVILIYVQSNCYQVNDLRYPTAEEEAQKHKLKRLVQAPNSYFIDVKCPGCFNMYVFVILSFLFHSTTVFSHAQSAVVCEK